MQADCRKAVDAVSAAVDAELSGNTKEGGAMPPKPEAGPKEGGAMALHKRLDHGK
jgi:hypothetical protein